VTDADLPDLVLTHRLRVELGDERLLVSVRLGALRPNGKPVAQAMSGDGSAAAFVKIGWNDLTRSLVRREAEQLAALWLPAPPRSFSVPRILWAGAWAGHELLAVQPAEGGPAPSQPPLAATAELAARGGLTRSALATSTWWQRVRARAGAAASGADTHRLQQAIDAVERRHGEDELVFGTAHGDWTPWNMAVRDGRLQVWDWERCATGVPVGLDIAHHLLLVALRRRRRPMPEALAETFERTPALIGQVGAEAAAGVAVVELELLEMAVRFAEARAAGVTVPHDVFLDTLLDLGNAT